MNSLFLFNLFSFLSALDFYLPIKIVYFHQITHSYANASLIISFVWISQALFEVPTGIFSDIIGRKKTIIAGAFCAALGYICYTFSNPLYLLFLGSFLEGASRSFFSGNNNAYLHNVLSEKNQQQSYHHFYGRLNAIIGVAMFMSALFSGFLATWSIHLFMWINVIPQVLSLLIACMLEQTSTTEKTHTSIFTHLKDALKGMKSNLNLRYLSLAEILGGGGLAAYEYQAAVFAAVWPTWAIGIARAIQEGGVIPSFWFAGKIIDKLGYVKVLATSWITSSLGNTFAAVFHSTLSPIFIMISLPFYGASDTAQQHILQKEFTQRQRATIASLNSLGNSITFSIVLYICGLIANTYGPFLALLATQIFLLPTNYFQYKFLSRIQKENL